MPTRLEITLDDDTSRALDAVAVLVDRPRTEAVRALIKEGLPMLQGNKLTLTITLPPVPLAPVLNRSRLSLRQAVQIALDYALTHPHESGLLPPLATYLPPSSANV